MKECIIDENSGDRHLDGIGVPGIAYMATISRQPVRASVSSHRASLVGANVPRGSQRLGGYRVIYLVTMAIITQSVSPIFVGRSGG
jgi:hypothetical protein